MSRPIWRPRAAAQDPFAALEAVQERVGRILGDAMSGYRGRAPGWHPDVDVQEDADGWLVEVRLPGVAPEEVAVEVTDRELHVRARHDDEPGSEVDGGLAAAAGDGAGGPAPRVAGRRWADFSYRLTVPGDADTDAIDATMDHGLLTIRLPRATTSRSRRITVARRGPGAAGGQPAVQRPDAD